MTLTVNPSVIPLAEVFDFGFIGDDSKKFK